MESSYQKIKMNHLKNTTPLCFLPNGKLVCYRLGRISILDDGKIERTFKVFFSFKEQFLGRFRLLFRFLRLGIRAAIAIDNESIIISIGNMIYELNLETARLSRGFYCGNGIRPLIFTEVKNLSTIKDGFYFGGYLGNHSKQPVNVYRRTGIDKWDIVYTFPQGMINHVHAIVSDPYRDCLWIYTGDFEEASAIWKVTDDFKSVKRVLYNDQRYRGCVVFALPEGLLYATDTPFNQNHLFLLKADMSLVDLRLIDGSCIYGCRWGNAYVFSTTVEPDGRNMNKLHMMFSRKKGCGIKDNYVHMYCGNIDEGFDEIYKSLKDDYPYCSFQFGVFRFPYGNNQGDFLYFQPIATCNNDMQLIRLYKNIK